MFIISDIKWRKKEENQKDFYRNYNLTGFRFWAGLLPSSGQRVTILKFFVGKIREIVVVK